MILTCQQFKTQNLLFFYIIRHSTKYSHLPKYFCHLWSTAFNTTYQKVTTAGDKNAIPNEANWIRF